MDRLSLPQVTLCAVDTRAPGLAMQSLLRSMHHCAFGQVLLFTHRDASVTKVPGIDVIGIDVIRSGAEYSHFVLRGLPGYITSEFVLVTQWDGYVVNPRAWSNDFLAYDYIGAPWPDQTDDRAVGNGGFSLRSQRFLKAGLDPRIEHEHPEDEVMCRMYKPLLEQEHGVRFAPLHLARQFAYENAKADGPTFGFHGPYNLPASLNELQMHEVVVQLPDDFFRSRDARRLARSLLRAGMPSAALRLLQRRRAAGRNDPNTFMLSVLSGLMHTVQSWTR